LVFFKLFAAEPKFRSNNYYLILAVEVQGYVVERKEDRGFAGLALI
jgi:hypothetical protein